MEASYNSWLVGLSILVAMVVAYTALKLAARVADAGPSSGRWWLLGGAAAMGMGIWSMHFIGMLAYLRGDTAALRNIQDTFSRSSSR